MASRHRSDITSSDLLLLARFASALNKVFIFMFSPVYELGTVDMVLPLWYLAGGEWKVSSYRVFTQEAIGLSRNGMIQLCRDYMKVPLIEVLELLHKLSMIAVVPGTSADDKPQFRQPFSGIRWDLLDDLDSEHMIDHIPAGFIIEKRRSCGGFRKRG